MYNPIIGPNIKNDKYVTLAYLLDTYTEKYYDSLVNIFDKALSKNVSKEQNKENIIKFLFLMYIVNCQN